MKKIIIEIDDNGGFSMQTDIAPPFVVFFLEACKSKFLKDMFEPKPLIQPAPPGFNPQANN